MLENCSSFSRIHAHEVWKKLELFEKQNTKTLKKTREDSEAMNKIIYAQAMRNYASFPFDFLETRACREQ